MGDGYRGASCASSEKCYASSVANKVEVSYASSEAGNISAGPEKAGQGDGNRGGEEYKSDAARSETMGQVPSESPGWGADVAKAKS